MNDDIEMIREALDEAVAKGALAALDRLEAELIGLRKAYIEDSDKWARLREELQQRDEGLWTWLRRTGRSI